MESLPFRRGFTLTELLVVLAIMMTISVIVLSSQSTFNKSLILSNTSYDIALALRSAESYGIGSRGAAGTQNAGYGLRFDEGATGSFLLFIDSYPGPSASGCHAAADTTAPSAQPGNCAYDSAQSERVSQYTLGNGVVVSDFCAYSSQAGWSCAVAQGGALSTLDIVFARPNPNPFISGNGSYSSSAPLTQACITVSSPQGGTRHLSVGSTGVIVANAASCP